MSRSRPDLRFDRTCLPSAFLVESHRAFAHALKLAVAARGALTLMDTGGRREAEQRADFAKVLETLEQWKLLPEGSSSEAIPGLGLDVQEVLLPGSHSARSSVRYLRRHPHDVVVLAIHHHDGVQRWTHPEVAPPERGSGTVTLFLPHEAAGFISEETGAVDLRSILVPVDSTPDSQRAVDAACKLAHVLGCPDTEGTLLYVGERDHAPRMLHLEPGAVRWRWAYREGDVDAEILRAAEEYHADLIVMSTEGRHGFLDALRGSTTERIVRTARCAVMAVPAYSDKELQHSTVIENIATGKLAI